MSSDEIKTVASISYCGYQLPNIHLSTDLDEFKKQFKKEFSLENILNENDKMDIYYLDESGKKINIEKNLDYTEMLKSFTSSNKKKIVFIETKKIPVSFEGGKSIEFEDEITKVVERELRIAANNIKKCLTTNLTLTNSPKVRNEYCDECNKQIIGCLYKKISPTENKKCYCELCSNNIDGPLFKIN